MAEIVNSNPLNEVNKPHSQNHSTFNLSFNFLHTPQFAKYNPILSREFVPDDGPISFRPQFSTRSYTLKAPLMQNIIKHVDYFQVPLQAILPFNWEKVYKNPVKGDDVNAELVNCVVRGFASKVYRLFSNWFIYIKGRAANLSTLTDAATVVFVRDLMRLFQLGELFFSNGCLLAHQGVHYGYRMKFNFSYEGADYSLSFDKFMDFILTNFVKDIVSSGRRVYLNNADGFEYLTIKTLSDMRTALELLRSDSTLQFEGFGSGADVPSLAVLSSVELVADYSDTKPLNFGRCVAYQLACAHFFTNDKIDYIFSAELYREHIYSLYRAFYKEGFNIDLDTRNFSYNGMSCRYDYLSGNYLVGFFSLLSTAVITSQQWYRLYPILQSIFGLNNSLRFQDYFVGARSNPRAVGDVNVQVNDNFVSVVDITKNTAKQRFLNAVNRVGMRIDEYIRGLFPGLGKFQPDLHDPQWLASSQDDIFTTEVENTGDAQIKDENSVTAVFRSNSNNFEFTYYGDRPAWIIGIEYFDIRRAYYTTQDRNTMAVDRYDMFIPDMQFVGDQDISMAELFAGAEDTPFAYTLRDMQFKQFYDEACGGFVENLPGWAFLFNPYLFSGQNENTAEQPIKPSFIRSIPTELDQFYTSLSGLSPASYFHFIEMVTWHIDNAKRPMVYAPEIL